MPVVLRIWMLVVIVLCAAMGVTYIWNIGGQAAKARKRLEARGYMSRWMPSWTMRAFGVWLVVVGIGLAAYIYAVTHGLP